MLKFRLPLLVLIALTLSTVAFIGPYPPLQNSGAGGEITYNQYWKKVDSLTKKGLSKSALEVVMNVYQKAKTENNSAQLVKAVIHRMKFQSMSEEDETKKIINDLTKDCKEAKFPANAILHSMLAETYWSYYQQNRYRFLDRTQTVNFQNDDISTWDARKIFEKTLKHYKLSLANSAQLQKVQVNAFDEVIIKGTTHEARTFRPSLYDFVAHRAVDFFMNEETGLTQPANHFEINSAKYLNDAAQFLNFRIPDKDSMDLKYNAIVLLQDLLRFHQGDAHPGALIDAELKRLKFVHDKLAIPAKDSLYLQALKKIADRYETFPGSTDALYEMAQYYYNKGSQYRFGENDSTRWLVKKAEELCSVAIVRFPYSQGGLNCKHLRSVINEKALSMQVERVNVPEQAFRAKISYKNVGKIFLRIAKLEGDETRDAELYGEKLIKHYLKLAVLKEWSVTLDVDSDKQSHSTEIKMPSMPCGNYVVLASNNEKYSYDKNAVVYSSMWISELSYVSRRKEGGSYDFYVFNRESGEPLRDVSATVYFQQYNYTSRKHEKNKGTVLTTDADGYFSLPPQGEYRNFNIEFVKGNDRLQLNDNFYQYRYQPEQKKRTQTFFFTDRAIYRPGQTVYFKGLMLETDGEKSEIKTKQNTTVQFFDVNSQKIAELPLQTNDYGTFNGTFTAPQGVLTGQMRIQNETGSVYLSVEEYKRPKFEMNFEPVKGSYRLNDKITLMGKAVSYSGANVSDAQVQYHVTRTARFPEWIRYWRSFFPSSPALEISNGTAATDENGNFQISFIAIPDNSISKETEPTFNYQVTADVTDVNGETYSDEESIGVSYKSLFLETDLKDIWNKDDQGQFIIHSKNTAGNFEPAQGQITIYKLKEPGKLLRKRLWTKSDKFTLKEDEYVNAFRYDVYDNEDEIAKWEKGDQVFSSAFGTQKDSIIKLANAKNWVQGKYRIELSAKDKYSQDVKYIQNITVFSPKEKQAALNSIDWFATLKDKAEPGEKAQFLIGTADKNVKVLYEIEEKNQIVSKQWLMLNNEQRLIEIPIEAKHRGNFAVHFTFVKHGRDFHFDKTITVPWTNKELDIKLETFRDKLQPGAKEEWRLKMKGKNGEKVAAEMLASMYDASLDAFAEHKWNFNIYNFYYQRFALDGGSGFAAINSTPFSKDWNVYVPTTFRQYDRLNWFGYYLSNSYYGYNGGMIYRAQTRSEGNTVMAEEMAPTSGEQMKIEVRPDNAIEDVTTVTGRIPAMFGDETGMAQQNSGKDLRGIKGRTNLNETAFFYPQLVTNDSGEIIFSFAMPEALTKWKMMALAHTKDLKYGQIEKEVVTQKELMVVPNAPRFFREGDKISFQSKVTNLSDSSLSGTVQLFLYDAVTMQPLNTQALERSFNGLPKGQNTSVSWDLTIPEGIGAITYKVVASAGKFTDGEEQAVPVLSNRMLVTESMPLPVRGKETNTFSFDKLLNSGTSSTLLNHKLTLEFTSNPAWYAIQALPYMMEYPYECSEQTFARYYANSIASHIANSSPKIKAVFDAWKSQSPETFLSNLEKNQELKLAMLEETPWVLEAKDESERKKRVALLFDINKMSGELQRAIVKLQKKQLPNGAWTWFEGMPDDRYITQYIIEGFGHLDHLGVKSVRDNSQVWNMIQMAVVYLDARITDDYNDLLKWKADLKKNHLSSLQMHYLYARSYFKDIPVAGKNEKAFNYFKEQSEAFWFDNNEYLKGMIALELFRYDNKTVANDILKSLLENSQYSDELGRYWKNNTDGYYWMNAPIETQSLLIEAFDEITKDKKTVDDLQVWLLKNKQTNDWKTTKATAEACYALLLRGTDFLAESRLADVTVGKQKINLNEMPDVKAEAGTGYFKTSWNGSDIKPEMATVKVENKNDVVAWGALYWQYFEQLDKITPHETPLKLNKKVFLEQNSSTGKVITPVDANTKVKIGDRLKIRIELRVDREMEYVMMKDMRASALEPENIFSQYKWQDGLGYYESTRDASTNFFFSYLPKGTYVFEYPLRVSQSGNFSNGITTIQCMYAPEFMSHSEGIRLNIEH
jgi:uncharacterized protein YfaS (alpha-2-macroglobulin family)